MSQENDSDIIDYPGGEVSYLKNPSHLNLDTLRAHQVEFGMQLKAILGEEKGDNIETFLKRPSMEAAAAITNDQKMLINLQGKMIWLKQLEEQMARRRKLYEEEMQNSTARFAASSILPALSELASQPNLAKALLAYAASLPWNKTLHALKMRLSLAVDPDNAHLQKAQGGPNGMEFYMSMHRCMNFFNKVFLDEEGYMLHNIDGRAIINRQELAIYTPGLLKIYDREAYTIPGLAADGGHGNALSYAIVDILEPHSFRSSSFGFWSKDVQTAFVFRDNIRNCAQILLETARNPTSIHNRFVIQVAQHLTQKYNEDSLATMLEQETLCEEMKHGINGLRSSQIADNAGIDSRDTRSSMRHFNEKRLTSNSVLRGIYASQLAEKENPSRARNYSDYTNIEECNAKLIRIIIGPDPHASLESMLSDFMTRVIHGAAVPSQYREHHGWLLTLMCKYAGASCKDDYAIAQGIQQILTIPKTELRRLAHHVFTEEFNERLEDTPFCTLDPAGNLVRHPGTLDAFARWA